MSVDPVVCWTDWLKNVFYNERVRPPRGRGPHDGLDRPPLPLFSTWLLPPRAALYGNDHRRRDPARRPRSAVGFRSARASGCVAAGRRRAAGARDRKSTRLNSSHSQISYAVFCLKKKKKTISSRATHLIT